MKLIHLMGMCLLTVVAMAQTETDTTKTYLDEVVVSVNRWEQNQREISNRVTKITPSLIQLQNPQTSADLLGLSNQVFIQKSQLGGGSPMIRGFATNRVLLVVDGVRMNNAIFRSGNSQNVISLDANSIQNTEVVFGPGSVVYGSDAIGGVMNFTTLTPTVSDTVRFSANAFARYASANEEKTGHVDFSIGSKKWAFVTSITKSDFSDLKMGSKGPVDYTRPDYQMRDENGNDIAVANPDPNVQLFSGYNQLNVMQKVRFTPNGHWDLTYGFHFSETSNMPRYDRLILKSANVFTSAEWYYGPQKWMMHALHAQFNKRTTMTDQIKFTVGYQGYAESRHNRNFFGSNRNQRVDRQENVKAFSINADADKQLNEKSNLFYGLEYVTNEVGSTAAQVNITNGTVSGISTRYPDGSQWRSMAAYAGMRYEINSKWIVNGSVRYTRVYTHAPFDTTYFDFEFSEATLKNSAANGSLGVAFNPTSNFKAYANAATGFRAPNIDDIGKVFDSEPGTVVVPNPTLKPETAYNAEIGFVGKIAGSLNFDLSAFYTLLDNAIVRGPSKFNGQTQIDFDGTLSDVLALQNISELTVRGFQLGLRWDFNKQFQLASNLNLQKGKEKNVETGEDVSPTHVAPSFGSTRFSYTEKKIRVTAYANYNGKIEFKDLALSERADSHLYAKDAEGNPYAPTWATFNFKSSFVFTKFISFDAGVENILDKRYRPYSSGITAPGRNFIFALRFKV